MHRYNLLEFLLLSTFIPQRGNLAKRKISWSIIVGSNWSWWSTYIKLILYMILRVLYTRTQIYIYSPSHHDSWSCACLQICLLLLSYHLLLHTNHHICSSLRYHSSRKRLNATRRVSVLNPFPATSAESILFRLEFDIRENFFWPICFLLQSVYVYRSI